jgi:adenylate kinase
MEYNSNSTLPNLIVTGTPGVGKTSLAMLLVEHLNEHINNDNKYKYVDIGKLIKEKNLYTDWNKEYDVPEFDEDKILEEIAPLLSEGGCVVDFHSAYFFDERDFKVVVLLRCDNTILYDRLKARNYDEKKIKENIECEIMEVTSEDVRENFPADKIIELPNHEIEDMEINIKKISEFLNSKL